ncbi:DUF2335 domain-containing protein [Candidatus Daviesbacteria bacterium]|nr:DUF2335 domain-containing protein [Candidatus Daviesbacteria bacterium]
MSRLKTLQTKNKEPFLATFPNPRVLDHYERIRPGSINRIISLAEQQAKHRQKLEREIVEANIKNEKRGRDYASAITILLVLIGGWLILQGKDIIGFIVLAGLPTFNVYNLFRGKKKAEEQLVEKEKEITREQKKKLSKK